MTIARLGALFLANFARGTLAKQTLFPGLIFATLSFNRSLRSPLSLWLASSLFFVFSKPDDKRDSSNFTIVAVRDCVQHVLSHDYGAPWLWSYLEHLFAVALK